MLLTGLLITILGIVVIAVNSVRTPVLYPVYMVWGFIIVILGILCIVTQIDS